MGVKLNRRVLGTPVVVLLFAVISLCVSLVLLPHKAMAATPYSFEELSSVQPFVAGDNAQIAARRSLYDDVVDTYRLFTGIAGGVFLEDYYFGETTKGLSYRQYYIRKAPTLLRIEPYDFGKVYIPGYGSGTGSVEVWQYSYEVH